MFRVIFRNVAWNWIGFAVNALVPLLLTPFVLHTLGEARYGVWILSVSVIGYYGLLDLGFRAGATQYITRYLAKDDFDHMNKTASSIFVALSAIGILILVLSFAAGLFVPEMVDVPAVMEDEVFWVIVIVGSSAAFQFSFFTYSAILVATQRYDIANTIGVTTRIFYGVAVYVTLSNGQGLIGLAIVMAATNFIDYAIRWRVAYRLVPQLLVSRKLANWQSAKEVLSFGIWNSINSATEAIERYTDVLIIGAFLPVAAIAPFSLAASLASYLLQFLFSAMVVLFPAATRLHAREDYEGLGRVFLDGSRMALLITMALVAVAGVWAEDFYRLWVGKTYEGTDKLGLIVDLFHIHLLALCFIMLPGTSGQLLLATKRVKPIALLSLVEAALNVVISLALVRSYGLIGIAIGTLVARITVRSVTFPLLVCRLLAVPLTTYFVNALPRPLVVGALLTLSGIVTREFFVPDTWLELVLVGLGMGALGSLFMVCIGLVEEERGQLLVWGRNLLNARSRLGN